MSDLLYGRTASGRLQPILVGDDGSPVMSGSAVSETTNTPAQVALTAATSGTLAAANASRIRFTIYNPTAAVLYVRKAATAASATAFDIVVPAGGSYFSDAYEYAGEIRGYSVPGGTINVSQSV